MSFWETGSSNRMKTEAPLWSTSKEISLVRYRDVERAILYVIATILDPRLAFGQWLAYPNFPPWGR